MTLSESHEARLTAALADRYRIMGELGNGRDGHGLSGRWISSTAARWPCKVLHPELAATVGHERFLREIEIVAGLTHPHILTLIDSGEADGLLFFVMPYVEGETLQARLDREGQLPVEEALRIAQGGSRTPWPMPTSNGVIHRDIKPSNILLEAGHAVISDFGVARAVGVAGVYRRDGHGHGGGDAKVHESGAGDRRRSGRSGGHLRPRLCAVGDVGG